MHAPAASGKQLQNIGEAILSLRERVAKLNTGNQIIFWFIGVAIVAGFGLVAGAGNLATLETVDFYGQAMAVRASMANTERALDQLAAKLSDKPGDKPGDKPADKSAQTAEITAALQAISADTVASRDLLKHLPEALPESGKVADTDRQRVMIASIVIRITTSVLLGFLIQVLLNVYRYNARLIAFYEARADALLLAGELDSAVLEKTARLLFPDKLELDKAPEPPAKQVLDMLKQLGALSAQARQNGAGHKPATEPAPRAAQRGRRHTT